LAKTLEVHGDARAVMVVYPTYQGICGDIEALIRITHAYNLPFLVDEAHGAHLAFHPDLPPSALSLGADLSVQSTHKVLGALSQASMVHLQGDRLDGHRLSQALQLLQTTSPSYILLASLDAARQQMALQGFDLMQRTLDLAQRARKELLLLPYLAVLSLPQPLEGFRWLDNTRLTIGVEKLGLTGYQVDEILRTQFHVTCELPLLRHLTFIVSIGNTTSDIERLIDAFSHLSASSPLASLLLLPPLPTFGALCLSPREAFFAPTQTVNLTQSLGKVSAELICPYPPGIPILIPGEVITQEAIAYLQILIHQGAVITGCSDSSLETVKICNN
jgi:lysine decarboxylase